MTPEARAGEVGGLRYLIAALPRPPVTKNERVGWSKGGVRFLHPSAREYRKMVRQVVAPALPERPFFRGRWHLDVLQCFAMPHDFDHYVSGVSDDLVEAGLAKDDSRCLGGPVVVHPYVAFDLIYVVAKEDPDVLLLVSA